MKQSLPSIRQVAYIPCELLSPYILYRYAAKLPVGIFSTPTSVQIFSDASCESESTFDKGDYIEKTELTFSTVDVIPEDRPLAFVVTDNNDQSYLIGLREDPFPAVEVTSSIAPDSNIRKVKVIFTSKKSLIPCSV